MKGIGVSPGISIGRAFVIRRSQHVTQGLIVNSETEKALEIEKFDEAVKISTAEIEVILSGTELQQEEVEILQTQVEFLEDPQIRADVLDKINKQHSTAHDSLIMVIESLVTMFRNMDSEYMRARSADIQDIGNRLLKHLNSSFYATTRVLERDTIIIADDILPSDAIAMDLKYIIGFATRSGSKTSHTAILAKARGIPAVVGCGDRLDLIKNNDVVIIDGKTGRVLINPDAESIEEYIRLRNEHIRMSEALKSLMDVVAVTTDGTEITLLGNISDAGEMYEMFESGGQGVGLFRTEMLFLGSNSLPSEDEQFDFYRKIAENSNDTPVRIRTIDIGGDKPLNYLNLPEEQNPFLGYRAIRISLDRPEMFITQLKAILRASAYGNFKIMFPMISGVKELREAKRILELAKQELKEDGISFDENIETGIMIEIPSAAVIADVLAKEVDFFSIGTNDLCQYTLAVDRMNEKIAYLYDHFDPGVLRLIQNVIEQAGKNGIPVGMCGEMASDPLAVPLLLGMGLREFSMSAGSIPAVKEIILNTSLNRAEELCSTVMTMDNPADITNYLRESLKM